MRVFYVIPGSLTGVDQIFAKRQVAALRDAGIHIITFFLKIWSGFPTLISEYVKLRRVIGQAKPDIIHARYGTMTAALCALTGVKNLVITYAGSDLNQTTGSISRRWLGFLLSQVAALKAKKIICVSEPLREKLWWKRGSAMVLPDGVDLSLFQPINRDEARNRLGWNLSECIVLFNAGKDPVVKGEKLAEAVVSVVRHLIGPIRLVKLHGDVDPVLMPFHYNAADCLLLASKSEGSPNVVKEAMACNLPVVSVNVGDVQERLAKVYPSVITDRDPLKLGTALADILQLNQRSNGREMVENVSLEATTISLIKVYSDLVKDSH
jgi:glycosyltransferase involved in cell wall biosynthesis